jgi:gentisate 1,2-dioxygenase
MNLGELEQWLAERNLGGHWNRHTDEGAITGVTPVEKASLAWNQGDIFVVPAWHWHSHENRSESDSILFSMTDAPTFSALGLYREESAT